MHLSQKGYGACPGTFSGYLKSITQIWLDFLAPRNGFRMGLPD